MFSLSTSRPPHDALASRGLGKSSLRRELVHSTTRVPQDQALEAIRSWPHCHHGEITAFTSVVFPHYCRFHEEPTTCISRCIGIFYTVGIVRKFCVFVSEFGREDFKKQVPQKKNENYNYDNSTKSY